ncbi:MAG: emp24/gp25L/p24 family protein [Candidatus Bathycorpusculaceae bacterium]
MLQCKKPLAYILLMAIEYFIILQLVMAAAVSFTVHGGEEVTKNLKLVVEDHVLIKFTVVGSPDNSLHFSLICPNGTVRDFGKKGDFRYSFVCNLEGEYLLHFSNIDSSGDKLVTLECEVEHYILGIPQMLFLTMVIVLVCVAALAAFVLMGKPR